MKKLFLMIIMLIIFPIGVLAESSDTIVIDFGKIKSKLDITYSQNYGLRILEGNHIISTREDGIYNSSGKKLVSADNNYNMSVPSNVTSSDNIEYTIKNNDYPERDVMLIRALKNKKKIIMKFDGKYEPKDTANYYFYDINKFIDESPAYGIFGIREIGKLLFNTNETGIGMDFLSLNNKKLVSFVNSDESFTIPQDVTSDDNVSFNLSNFKYKYYDTYYNEVFIPYEEEDMSVLMNNYKIQRFLFAPEENKTTGAKITNLEVDSLSDSVAFKHMPSFNNLSINSDVLFSVKDEYVKYKMIIHNYDKEDYKISLDNLNSKYFTYTLSSENNKLKANSDNTVYLTIKYNKEANPNDFVNGKINDNKSLKIVLTKSNIIINPKTGGIILSVLAIILLMISATVLTKSKKIKNKLLIVLISFITILPISVFALKQITLNVTANNTILDTYNYSDNTFIRYKEIPLSETILMDIEDNLRNKCSESRIVNNGYEIDFYDFDEHGATAYIKDFPASGEENLDIQATVSIETDTDTEAGGTKLVIGECTHSPEVAIKNYYNYGRKLNDNSTDRKLLSNYIEERICPRFREILEGFDAECFENIIEENLNQNQAETGQG